MKHFAHFHILDVMELSPIEGNIYSFHSVGPDVSMEVKIEPIYDSFVNTFDIKGQTDSHHLKPDCVNSTSTHISTPVKVACLPTACDRCTVGRSYTIIYFLSYMMYTVV